MEKNLVLTICVGAEAIELSKLTHATIKNYADRINAEFMVINSSNTTTPHWEKFQIHDLLNTYDRIIYLDTDLIIRDDCPDLFKIVPYSKIGMFNEARFVQREYSLLETSKVYGVEINRWNGKYYNTGVMVLSKCHKNIFKKPSIEFSNFYEQGYLNLKITLEEENHDPKDPLVFDLNYKFNRMTCLDISGEDRHASYIIHYAGFHYVIGMAGIIPLIKQDLEQWSKDSPAYSYKKHLLMEVNGGLGDQICAEPSIRYLKKLYPNDEIIIKTHWPRIFEHLGLPVYHHSDFVPKPDIPYHKRVTLPGPDTVNWSVVSNLMSHTIDYCSMAILGRILPVADKAIQLRVTPEDEQNLNLLLNGFDLSKSLIVHAGRHWQSKTFPREWWQEVVNKISKHIPVCLIGTNDHENRGVYPLDIPSNSIDLIDRTSIGCLIAAISRAKALLSNDSAPVHFAGAFDNWIVLIPSCKHPEHVLPFRHNEGTFYKTRALYKRLTLDDCEQRPTAWIDGESSGEFIKREWSEYLPDVDVVCDEIMKIFNGTELCQQQLSL